jgi:PKD repeat protein
MSRKPGTDRALSDTVSIALIIILIVIAAMIVFIVVFGYAHLMPKSAYISMRGVATNTSVGAATLTLFHFEGDAVNLNGSVNGRGVAPVRFNLLTPQNITVPVGISPLITDNTWNSGDTITIYEDGAGYWVIDNVTSRIGKAGILGPLVNMQGGNYTVSVVDTRANVLIGQVPIIIGGIGITGPQYSPGLIATYFTDTNNQHWTTPAAVNIASRIHYADTASGSPSDVSNWPVGYIGEADHFSVKFDGFVKIDTADDYTFYLTSDDGSFMDLDGSSFISNGNDHSPLTATATKHLTPGYHPVSLRMYENAGGAVVYLEYSSPNITRQIVTPLYHIPSTKPVAGFIAVPRAGPAPLVVQFTDTSLDATSWSWDFGDGSSQSSAKNPSHTYITAGTYSVTLTATNKFGSTMAQKNGYITVGSFTPGLLASYYYGMTWSSLARTRVDPGIDFTDQGSSWPNLADGRQDNFSVMWDGYILVPSDADYSFSLTSDDGSWLSLDETQLIDNGGDHSSATVTQTTHLTAGYHHLVVKMYENGGAAVAKLTSSPAVTFWHIPSTSPVADFTAVPRAGPAPLSVQFNDASTDAGSWSWDFGDGTPVSIAQNPVHSYTTTGTYSIKLTAGNSFGSNTAEKDNYITVGSFNPGLLASYYYGMTWSSLAVTRVDPGIDFTDQGSTWPNLADGRQDNFGVIWDGYINVPAASVYSFSLTSDDGSWLWVDENELIDNGGDHSSATVTKTTSLTAGYHHVVVKYYENGGAAVAKLTASPSVTFYYMP